MWISRKEYEQMRANMGVLEGRVRKLEWESCLDADDGSLIASHYRERPRISAARALRILMNHLGLNLKVEHPRGERFYFEEMPNQD